MNARQVEVRAVVLLWRRELLAQQGVFLINSGNKAIMSDGSTSLGGSGRDAALSRDYAPHHNARSIAGGPCRGSIPSASA